MLRAGLEIISIVLGVLLALAVSEWQENRSNLERTEAASSTLISWSRCLRPIR